jgi:DNA-binding beta-propeller fold protein YncE
VNARETNLRRGLALLIVAVIALADAGVATTDAPPPLLRHFIVPHPVGVTVAPNGDIYVACLAPLGIQVFANDSTFKMAWGLHGPDPWSVNGPKDLALADAGHLFVVGGFSNPQTQSGAQIFTATGDFVARVGRYALYGDTLETFLAPFGLALGPDGNFYVNDHERARLKVITPEGVFLRQWPTRGYDYDVAVDRAGNVFVCESDGVTKYTSTGAELTHWGSAGSGPGQFAEPWGVDVDAEGNVYVADTFNSRVQVFTGDGTFVTEWGSRGFGLGQFNQPQGIAVDGAGRIYVADSFNGRIKIFGSVPTSARSTSWGQVKARYR